MTRYETYVQYLALKHHFAGDSYDFFKYNGKVKLKPETFAKVDKKFQYYYPKLSGIDTKWFFISNLIEDRWWFPKGAPYFVDDEKNYLKYHGILDSLKHSYTEDLKKIGPFTGLLSVEEGTHPHLLKLIIGKKINWVSSTILLDLLPSVKELYQENMFRDSFWKEAKITTEKLLPFIKYDKQTYKALTKKYFAEVGLEAT